MKYGSWWTSFVNGSIFMNIKTELNEKYNFASDNIKISILDLMVPTLISVQLSIKFLHLSLLE